ncbi:unnamed protein product, partial [Penicillium olsonii]
MSRKCGHGGMFPRHFILMYIDRDGTLRQEMSSSLYDRREDILSAQVTARFLKVVAESGEANYPLKPAPRLPAAHPVPPKQLSHATSNAGCQELREADSNRDMFVPQVYFMQPAPAGSKTIFQCGERVGIQDLNASPHSASIPISDSTILRRYYEKVFQNLQQTNCRVIAKVYVKIIEPRKQVQYPYNGRKTVAGITQQLSPEETKPPWWPPGVSHREPDHLPKAGKKTFYLLKLT